MEQKSRENRQPISHKSPEHQPASVGIAVVSAAEPVDVKLEAKSANRQLAAKTTGRKTTGKTAAGNATPSQQLSSQQLRVLQTLRWRSGIPDRVPKGEFGIEPKLCRRLIDLTEAASPGQPAFSSERDRLRRALEILGVDFTAINPVWPVRQRLGQDEHGRELELDFWGNQVAAVGSSKGVVVPACKGIAELSAYQLPQLDQVDFAATRHWSQETPFFIFTQVPGPFSLLAGLTSFLDFLGFTATHPQEIKRLALAAGEWLGEYGRRCVRHGAQGIVITDDLAYDRGPWIAPVVLDQLFFPAFAELVREVKDLEVPVVLHSDGDMRLLLPYLAELGFDGLHSLQPSAGNQLGEIKAQYGAKLCLLGNLDCNYLLPQGTVSEVIDQTEATLRVGAPGGGFILSSSAGILSGDWPAENVLAMYQTAEKFSLKPTSP